MRTKIMFYIFAVAMITAQSLAAQTGQQGNTEKKVLVAFFSRADENYGVGFVEKGNTQIIAEIIAKHKNADLFHIQPVKPYPKTYNECIALAKEELRKKARPAVSGKVSAFDKYDVIFLGYPNWWGDMPMAVYTFLESYDFSGKTIIPFCTHEGSGLSNTVKSIVAACPKAKVLNGFAMRGTTAQKNRNSAETEVVKWLEKIKD